MIENQINNQYQIPLNSLPGLHGQGETLNRNELDYEIQNFRDVYSQFIKKIKEKI